MIKKNLSPNALIIAICELLNSKNMVSSYGGNISVKTSANKILITPAESSLSSISEDELVLVERSGDVLMGEATPSSELFLHSAIYDVCNDIGGIIHTHSSLLSAFAQTDCGVDLITSEAKKYLKKIPVIKKDNNMVKNIQNAVCDYSVLLLEGHGVISCGKNLIEAYNNIELAEDAARLNLYMAELKAYKPTKNKKTKKEGK